MWKPKSQKTLVVVKICVWSGLITWMTFAVVYSLIAAQRLGLWSSQIFGSNTYGHVLSYVAPTWIVFTTLMLCWAIARWVNKAFRRTSTSEDAEEEELEEEDSNE